MAVQHVVVDGSNIATEGRTTPSLHQLDEAVTAFLEEHTDVDLTVVVDATFGHRIANNEKAEYEEAIINGELVTPPAGAIGRGDAFVLQIADRANAVVFSNDSFQEFHGSYEWLFDEGRLIGGKPVAHVGWVFVLRTPVRGPTSRRSTRDARGANKRTPAAKAPSTAAKPARGTKAAGAGGSRATTTTKRSDGTSQKSSMVARKVSAPVTNPVQAEAVEESQRSGRSRRRRGGAKAPESVNDPIPFLQFVGNHPVGSEVQGLVDRFSSHGAYVVVDGAQCYIPLKAMGDPPPTSAREALEIGEVRTFVVQSFDTPRRGIDLSIFGIGEPPDVSAPPDQDTSQDKPAQEAPSMAPAKKKAAKKSTAARKLASKKSSPARKAAAGRKLAKKSTAKKSTAKKATKKSTAKRATKKSTAKKAAKKSPAKKAAKKSTAKRATKKSPAKKAGARKSAAKKR